MSHDDLPPPTYPPHLPPIAEDKRQPGWYPDAELPMTLRFHDGERWTQHLAPSAPPQAPAPAPSGGASFWKIALAVATGIAVVIAVLMIWSSMESANDGVECSTENVERALDGRPARYCP